ncbi:MAG: universal stress protein [Dehalococcoidales bacterium]|jgi:nucleotide-binding universal stress UspA family protein
MEFNKILVPVSGSSVDNETIKLACGFTKKNKGKIWAVYVIGIKRVLPLDAEIEAEVKKAESILDHVEEIGEEEGYEITTDLIQSRDVGPAIVDEAVEQGADLIVLGASYKRHFGQFSLGDVIPYLLKNAPCPVILYHKPAGRAE